MNETAKKPPMTRDSLLPLLAAHVLTHGLGQASLRPLARAAGTSDRMLLYHFGSKEALMADAPAMQPFLALWWEIVAGAVRGIASYRAAARAMMDELLGWLETQMPADDPDPKGGARYLLTFIEGTLMLSAIDHGDTAHDGLLASGLLRP